MTSNGPEHSRESATRSLYLEFYKCGNERIVLKFADKCTSMTILDNSMSVLSGLDNNSMEIQYINSLKIGIDIFACITIMKMQPRKQTNCKNVEL